MKVEELIKKLEKIANKHQGVDIKLYATSCVREFCGVTNYRDSWLRDIHYNKDENTLVLSD
jgi:hypothetical protein